MGTELGPNASLLTLGELFLGKEQEMTDLADLVGHFHLVLGRGVTLNIRKQVSLYLELHHHYAFYL